MPESGANSLDAFWMPFTPNRRFKANPRMIASARDIPVRFPGQQPLQEYRAEKNSGTRAEISGVFLIATIFLTYL